MILFFSLPFATDIVVLPKQFALSGQVWHEISLTSSENSPEGHGKQLYQFLKKIYKNFVAKQFFLHFSLFIVDFPRYALSIIHIQREKIG
jgi:hypothetical protein